MDKPDNFSLIVVILPAIAPFFFFFCCKQPFPAFHWGVGLYGKPEANGIKAGNDAARTKGPSAVSHPWVPEELGEDDQVGRVQREAHVGRRDGQDGHAGLGRELEPLAQLLALG